MCAVSCRLSVLPSGLSPVVQAASKAPRTRGGCAPSPVSDPPFASSSFQSLRRPQRFLSSAPPFAAPVRPSDTRSSSSRFTPVLPPSKVQTIQMRPCSLRSCCEHSCLLSGFSFSAFRSTYRCTPQSLFFSSSSISRYHGISSQSSRHEDTHGPKRLPMLCSRRGLATRRHAKTVKLNTVRTLRRAKNAYKQYVLRRDPRSTYSHFIAPSSSSMTSSDLSLSVASSPVPLPLRPPSKHQLRSPYANPYLYSSSLSPAPLPSPPPILFHKVVLVDDSLAQRAMEARIRKSPLGNVKKLKAFELTTALCTYAQVYIHHKSLWSELILECMRRYKDFSVSEASWVLHAFAEAHDRRRRELNKKLFFSPRSSPDEFLTPSLQETCRRLTLRVIRESSLLTLPDSARILHATATLRIMDPRLIRVLDCLIPQLLPSWCSGVRTPQETHRILQLLVCGFARHGLHSTKVFKTASEIYSSHIDRWVDIHFSQKRKSLRRSRKSRMNLLAASSNPDNQEGVSSFERTNVGSPRQEGQALGKSERREKLPVIFRLKDLEEEEGAGGDTAALGGEQGGEQAQGLLPKPHRIVSVLQAFACLQFQSEQLITSVCRLLHATIPAYHGGENTSALSCTSSLSSCFRSSLYRPSPSSSRPSVSSAVYWSKGRGGYRYRYTGARRPGQGSSSPLVWTGLASPSLPCHPESSRAMLRYIRRSPSSKSPSLPLSFSPSSLSSSTSSDGLPHSRGPLPLSQHGASPATALSVVSHDTCLPSPRVPSPSSVMSPPRSRRARALVSLPPGSEASLATALMVAPRQLLRRRRNERATVSFSSPCISPGCYGFSKQRRKPMAEAEKEKSKAGRFQRRVDWRRMLRDTLAVHIPPNTRSPFINRRGQMYGGGMKNRWNELEAKRAVALKDEIQRQLKAWTLNELGSVLSSLASVGVRDPYLVSVWKEGVRYSLHRLSLEDLIQTLNLMRRFGVYGRALRYRICQRLSWLLAMKTGKITDADDVIRLSLALTDMPTGPLEGEQEFRDLLSEVRRRLTRTSRTWLKEEQGEEALRDAYRILVKKAKKPSPLPSSEHSRYALRPASSVVRISPVCGSETKDIPSSSSSECLSSLSSLESVKSSSTVPLSSSRVSRGVLPSSFAAPTSHVSSILASSPFSYGSCRLPLQSPAALFPWRPVEAVFPCKVSPSLLPPLLHVVVSLFPFSSPIPLELLLPRIRQAGVGACLSLHQLHQIVRDLRSWVQLHHTAGIWGRSETPARSSSWLYGKDERDAEAISPYSSFSVGVLDRQGRREEIPSSFYLLSADVGAMDDGQQAACPWYNVNSTASSVEDSGSEDAFTGEKRNNNNNNSREPQRSSGSVDPSFEVFEAPSKVVRSPGETRVTRTSRDTRMIEDTEAAIWHAARLRARLLLSSIQPWSRRPAQGLVHQQDGRLRRGERAELGREAVGSDRLRPRKGAEVIDDEAGCSEKTQRSPCSSKFFYKEAKKAGQGHSLACLTELANHGILLINRLSATFCQETGLEARSEQGGEGQGRREEELQEARGEFNTPPTSSVSLHLSPRQASFRVAARSEFSSQCTRRHDNKPRGNGLLSTADVVQPKEETLPDSYALLKRIRSAIRCSQLKQATGEHEGLGSREASPKYQCFSNGPFYTLDEALAVLALETAPYTGLLLSREPFAFRESTPLGEGASGDVKTRDSHTQREFLKEPTVDAIPRALWEPAPDILGSLVGFLSSTLLFATEKQIVETTRIALAVLRHPVWLHRLEAQLFRATAAILGCSQPRFGDTQTPPAVSLREREIRTVQGESLLHASDQVFCSPEKGRDSQESDKQTHSEWLATEASSSRYRTPALKQEGEDEKRSTKEEREGEFEPALNAIGLRPPPGAMPGFAAGDWTLDVWENVAAITTLLLQQQQKMLKTYRADDLLLVVADLQQVAQGIQDAFKRAFRNRVLFPGQQGPADANISTERPALDKGAIQALDMLFGNSLQLIQLVESTVLPDLLNRLRDAPHLIQAASPTVALRVALQSVASALLTGEADVTRRKTSKNMEYNGRDGRSLLADRKQLEAHACSFAFCQDPASWVCLERLATLSAEYPLAAQSAFRSVHDTVPTWCGPAKKASEALGTVQGTMDRQASCRWVTQTDLVSNRREPHSSEKSPGGCKAVGPASEKLGRALTKWMPDDRRQYGRPVAHATSASKCKDNEGEADSRRARRNKQEEESRHDSAPELRRRVGMQEIFALFQALRKAETAGVKDRVSKKRSGCEREPEWTETGEKRTLLWRGYEDVALLVVSQVARNSASVWCILERIRLAGYRGIAVRVEK
ncbi:hypothetical protein CSUI_007473 [Cystoisospora suis]|uniref:Uncharacterized protein n=1 Tax=Cystoisospora suis TaxID=483139 RepID=A0A2C6JUR7_9APIC|nr:hypothetical protein CSUI_007473 [Cystoisospora suis]